MIIEFTVPGRAAPQGSKAFKGFTKTGHAILAESSTAVGPWRKRVAICAHNAMQGKPPTDSAVVVRVGFILPRPKSAPKRSTPLAVKRPDIDKLGRAILDALSGVIFCDDSQVVDLTLSKRLAAIGEQPHANISIDWQVLF